MSTVINQHIAIPLCHQCLRYMSIPPAQIQSSWSHLIRRRRQTHHPARDIQLRIANFRRWRGKWRKNPELFKKIAGSEGEIDRDRSFRYQVMPHP